MFLKILSSSHSTHWPWQIIFIFMVLIIVYMLMLLTSVFLIHIFLFMSRTVYELPAVQFIGMSNVNVKFDMCSNGSIQVWWVKANPCHNAWGQLTGPASLDFFELCQRNLLTQKKLCEYSRKHQGGVRSAQWLHHKIHSKQPYNMCFEILVLPVPCRRLGGSSLMPEHAVSPHFSDIVLTSLEPPSSILELLYLQGYL